jgi:hypothetical protein
LYRFLTQELGVPFLQFHVGLERLRPQNEH